MDKTFLEKGTYQQQINSTDLQENWIDPNSQINWVKWTNL